MELNIEDDITYRIFKGEIHKKCKNPWIRPFLRYIAEHPHANEEDICRDLFCDTGKPRKAAVKNILFFFKQQGLICYDSASGYSLADAGMKAFETSEIWEGMKGAFVITLWKIGSGLPLILDVQQTPDHWFDNGNKGLEEFPEEYGENLKNLTICCNDTLLDVVGKQARPTYFQTKFKADVNSKRKVTLSADPKVDGTEPYELEFTLDEDAYASIIDG